MLTDGKGDTAHLGGDPVVSVSGKIDILILTLKFQTLASKYYFIKIIGRSLFTVKGTYFFNGENIILLLTTLPS